jgi:hypothetical protein
MQGTCSCPVPCLYPSADYLGAPGHSDLKPLRIPLHSKKIEALSCVPTHPYQARAEGAVREVQHQASRCELLPSHHRNATSPDGCRMPARPAWVRAWSVSLVMSQYGKQEIHESLEEWGHQGGPHIGRGCRTRGVYMPSFWRRPRWRLSTSQKFLSLRSGMPSSSLCPY